MLEKISVILGGDTLDLESALIYGKVDDVSPTALYSGPLNANELHTALFYTNRTIVKLLTNECDVPPEDVEALLYATVHEALAKEKDIKSGKAPDKDNQYTMKKIRK